MKKFESWTAFIPAAGYGTRMGKICEKNQKCMLPIWNMKQPMLYYIVENLKMVGCQNIIIAVNHQKKQVKDYFDNGDKFGIKIKYVEGLFTSTYDTLWEGINLVPDKFIYTHGDVIFHPYLYNQLLETYESNGNSTIALISSKNLNMTHPQLTISNNMVTSIHFGVPMNSYPYMFLGGAIYNKKDFTTNFNGDRSGMVEKVVQQKLDQYQQVNTVLYEDTWRHLMNEKDYHILCNEKNWIKLL